MTALIHHLDTGPRRRRNRAVREALREFVERGTIPPLLLHHGRYFASKLAKLHPILLPGRDKSESAIASLANGAFASFAKEPKYPGERPAFKFAYDEHAGREPSLLYYWRDSATDRYLREIADDTTRGYLNTSCPTKKRR